MISFNYLGNLGHIGNQMFQYASLKGIAKKNNTEFCFPKKKYFGRHYNVISFIDDCFDLDCRRELTEFQCAREEVFSFDERFFNIKQDLDIFGFFQTEKYFKHIEDEIRKDFVFKNEILEPCKEMISFDNVISLHIRRTDYLTNSNHPVQTLKYYESALKYFDDSIPVLIFSDDTSWCKEQEIFSDDRFMISESSDCYVDLCLMSLCNNHIIANSSFSWWGAWLAGSDNVVAPQNWFSGDCINHNTDDIYLPHWRILE